MQVIYRGRKNRFKTAKYLPFIHGCVREQTALFQLWRRIWSEQAMAIWRCPGLCANIFVLRTQFTAVYRGAKWLDQAMEGLIDNEITWQKLMRY